MSEAAENLKPALSSLPESDREELANFLLQSLDQEDSGEDVWDTELLRRMEELETGRAKGLPADELFRCLREKYP